MIAIRGRNPQQLLSEACMQMMIRGWETESRNGRVRRFVEPCTLVYENPMERVIFDPDRNANPFFHFMESLWMLAGRNDVEFLTKFVKTMSQFSDDGITFHGAYGYRWRRMFNKDQLVSIIDSLVQNPNSRREVLQMWNSNVDLGYEGKDFPCNTHIYFSIVKGHLDMTVCNRSNDLIWGALGANIVHFSVLQQFMAAAIGAQVGKYYQVSNNMHIYERHFELMGICAMKYDDRYELDPYESSKLSADFSLTTSVQKLGAKQLLFEIEDWINDPFAMGYRSSLIKHVAAPMLKTFETYKAGGAKAALEVVGEIQAPDWCLACIQWLERKVK